MPELPEVETVRRGLQAQVAGRRIERVEVGRERTVRLLDDLRADLGDAPEAWMPKLMEQA